MGAAQTIAGTLGSLVAAVSTQLSGYFSDQNRLRRELVIPSVGFLLGCLALLFILLGPDVPRAWWDGLPADIRFLVGGLAAICVVLVAEVSRLLMTTVRRLFAGELGVGFWWRQRLRQRYLDAWDAHQQHATELERVQARLTAAKSALDLLSDAPVATQDQAPRHIYVPRFDIPAYRWIAFSDLTTREGEPDPTTVTAVEELVGRYSREPLVAGQPVLASHLGPRVRAEHLGAGRRLVLLRVARPEAVAHLHAGDIVTVCSAPASAAWDLNQVDDVLVVDLLGASELLLSVRSDRVTPLLSWSTHGEVALVRASASQPRLLALPVVGKELRPGERITRGHVSWAVMDANLLVAPPRQATREAQVVDRVYWPREVGLTLDPTLSDVVPVVGSLFELTDLLPAPVTGWLGASDEDGQPRRGYRLSLPAPGQKTAWPIHEPACHAGDVLTVSFEQPPGADPDLQHGEHGCYVYEVRDGWCAVAVRDPQRFHQSVIAATAIRLSSLVGVPVLREARRGGQLISAEQVVIEQRRASEIDPGTVCLSPDEVIDHFVDVRVGSAAARQPVRRDLLGPTVPSPDWVEWIVRANPAATPITMSASIGARMTGVDPRVIQRGDLVHVRLVDPAGVELSWDRSFVREVTRDGNGNLVALSLMTPPEDLPLAERLWADGAALAVSLQASDTESLDTREAISTGLALLQETGRMSQLFSRDRTDIREVFALADNVDELVYALQKRTDQMRLRPWQAQPEGAGYSFAAAWADHWAAVGAAKDLIKRWQELLVRYQLRTEQAAQLALPDSVSDVRATRLGNVLAAANGYPAIAYGIDTGTILPRLLQVLRPDDPVLARLVGAEAALNMLLMFSFWSAAWTALGFAAVFATALRPGSGALWLPGLTILGAVLAWLTKNAAVEQGIAYGESLKALFDLRRRALFQEMAFDLDDAALTSEQESAYWANLYRLFATGDASGVPPMKSRDSSGARPAASSSGA